MPNSSPEPIVASKAKPSTRQSGPPDGVSVPIGAEERRHELTQERARAAGQRECQPDTKEPPD